MYHFTIAAVPKVIPIQAEYVSLWLATAASFLENRANIQSSTP
jgi:hypothetical protein